MNSGSICPVHATEKLFELTPAIGEPGQVKLRFVSVRDTAVPEKVVLVKYFPASPVPAASAER